MKYVTPILLIFLSAIAHAESSGKLKDPLGVKDIHLGDPLSKFEKNARFECGPPYEYDVDIKCVLKYGEYETIAKIPIDGYWLGFKSHKLVSIQVLLRPDGLPDILQALRLKYGSDKKIGNSPFAWETESAVMEVLPDKSHPALFIESKAFQAYIKKKRGAAAAERVGDL